MRKPSEINFGTLDNETKYSQRLRKMLPDVFARWLINSELMAVENRGWIILFIIAMIVLPEYFIFFVLQLDIEMSGVIYTTYGVFLVLIGYALYCDYTASKHREERLRNFAQRNSLSIRTEKAPEGQIGMFFQVGKEQEIIASVTDKSVVEQVTIGSYKITTGSGDYKSNWYIGFVELTLPRALPNIVLDAKANNNALKLTNLPKQFLGAQRLELEGGFGRYFTLFCPQGKERDALYIFTPDVMRTIIDEVQGQYDIEITEDKLYIYSNQPFDITSESYRKLYTMVYHINEQISKQARSYTATTVARQSLGLVDYDGCVAAWLGAIPGYRIG